MTTTPETKMVLAYPSTYQPDSSIIFNLHNREVLRISRDGRMIKGEGLSWEEATQQAAKLLIASFKEQIQKMVDNRIADDTARLDWLEANPEAIRAYSINKSTFGRKVWWDSGFNNHDTAREAIDAAMKETSK